MEKRELLLTARKEIVFPKSKGLKIIDIITKENPKKGMINLDKLEWTVEESRRSQVRRSPRRNYHKTSKSNLNVSSYIDGTVSNDFEDHIGLRMNTDTTNKNSVLEDESIPENLAVSQSQSMRRRDGRRRGAGANESEEMEEDESSGFGFIKQERGQQPSNQLKTGQAAPVEEEESNPFGVVRKAAEARGGEQLAEASRPAVQKRPTLKTGESGADDREYRGGIGHFAYGLDPNIYNDIVPARPARRLEKPGPSVGRVALMGEIREALSSMRREAGEVTGALECLPGANEHLRTEGRDRAQAKSEWLRCLEEDQENTKRFANKVRAMRDDRLQLANFERLVDGLLAVREGEAGEEARGKAGEDEARRLEGDCSKAVGTAEGRIREQMEGLAREALRERRGWPGSLGEEVVGELEGLERRLRREMAGVLAMEESLDPEVAMLEAQKRIQRLKRLDLALEEVRRGNQERFEGLKQKEVERRGKERARRRGPEDGQRPSGEMVGSWLGEDYGESQEELEEISWVEVRAEIRR